MPQIPLKPPRSISPSTSPKKTKIDKIRGLEREISATLSVLNEKLYQLEALNEFSALLNSTLDPSQVKQKALEATCRLLKCETGSLLLLDAESGELYWETALGPSGDHLKTMRLPLNEESVAGYVALHGEAAKIDEIAKDERHSQTVASSVSKVSGFVTRNMLCVPLITKGKVIGVLQALNKQNATHFADEDLRLFQTLSNQVAIAVENSRLYSDLKSAFYGTVEALAESIEKKDSYTGGHTKRVVHYSLCIASQMDLTFEELERVKLGALLHDVGKIGIEDKILRKDSPLDQDEWKVMQRHPMLGADILGRVEGLKDVIGAMKFHHERWDGKGYPDGLKGESIPLIARIVAVADAYDAMVSTRPYRKGLNPDFAYREITRYSGTQFDPAVVTAFQKAYEQDGLKRSKGPKRQPEMLSNCD